MYLLYNGLACGLGYPNPARPTALLTCFPLERSFQAWCDGAQYEADSTPNLKIENCEQKVM